MARKRLVPTPGYGQALYDCIKAQRRADGTTWEAEDLAEQLAGQGVSISAKQLREWMRGRGGVSKIGLAVAIAELFGTTVDEMWRGTCKQINLPQARRSQGEGPTPPGSDGGDRERERASAERAVDQAHKAGRGRPSRRRSS